VVKPQGRRGEVAVELLTDFPERFEERREFSALAADGQRRMLQVENLWPHKGRLVIKFAGIESINDAERLAGCELQIPTSERAQLEAGSAYVHELVGCRVTASEGDSAERDIGIIVGVQFGAGEAPLLLVKQHDRELMIPFAAAYVVELDVKNQFIRMRLPEDMLSLDAPLSEEEKQEQRRTPKN
jgi:16S rRNA processing protein RimM